MSIQILKTDGSSETVNLSGEPSLAQMQAWVEGYIIPAPLGNWFQADGMQAFCNEEGLRLNLRPNLKASRMFNQHLVGNIVILADENCLT